MEIGKKTWVIAEGFLPEEGQEAVLDSHETACILNAGDSEANIEIHIYYSDKDPAGPYRIKVPAKRTKHMRFNDLKDPVIPKGVDYSSVFISDVPVVVQHSRLDARQAQNALLTTIAYSE